MDPLFEKSDNTFQTEENNRRRVQVRPNLMITEKGCANAGELR
jgi:hypothetical protein